MIVKAHVVLGALLACAASGCGGTMIEPGHRGLLFDAKSGLNREVLQPGIHRIASSARIDDFDVTYSSRHEALHLMTSEGLTIDVKLSVIYRPIIAELYELDTEIGTGYYDEVVGPEFRAAAREAFAHRPLSDLMDPKAMIEDEIENTVRARVAHKHVEIAAVTLESVNLPPEIVAAIRARLLADETARKKKAELESAWEREKIELEHDVERKRLQRAAQPP